MARVFQSNIDEVNRWVAEFVETIDFTTEVGATMLVEDIRDLIAIMIRQRSINEQAGASVYWLDNKEPYKSWKRIVYGAAHVGELSGQMLSLESLKGVVVVTHDSMTMYYGIGKPSDRFKTQQYGVLPQGTRFGRRRRTRPAKPRDPPTDVQKGRWFTDGSRKQNRPARPFYELDDQIEAAAYERIEEFVADLFT